MKPGRIMTVFVGTLVLGPSIESILGSLFFSYCINFRTFLCLRKIYLRIEVSGLIVPVVYVCLSICRSTFSFDPLLW